MDGHVPQNSDAVILGDSLGFMLIPSFLHLNAKLFADCPVHVCSCLVVGMDVFSFSKFRAARDQVVNGLIETATQSIFWVHVRLLNLEDVVLGACWEALILGLLLLLLLLSSSSLLLLLPSSYYKRKKKKNLYHIINYPEEMTIYCKFHPVITSSAASKIYQRTKKWHLVASGSCTKTKLYLKKQLTPPLETGFV